MERNALAYIRGMYGENFIGFDELLPFINALDLKLENIQIPELNFSLDELRKYSKDYILIMGIKTIGCEFINIRFLRSKFGVDPESFQPCFYNQDWYINELFLDKTLENRWYLLKKNVIEESRAVQPNLMLSNQIVFPSAILCAYAFFAYYFARNKILWKYDFVWCSDFDHNDDRIYVGKYLDVDGVNKNGFSIHRHLSLRSCYGSISVK